MRRDPGATTDEGFSLIEVIVALFIVGMIASAVLVFFVRGSSTASHLQRTQASASIATQAMEKVRSVRPRPGSPTVPTPLVIGREKADVAAGFAKVAALDPTLVAETNQLWDPAPSGDPTLKVEHEVRVSDMTYDVTTLIGSCYRAKSASASDTTCVRTNPGASAALVYRAIVVVTWDPGVEKCGGDGCFYPMTTLIDPNTDATWNISTAPVANDDEIAFSAGSPARDVDILANDVIVSNRSNPTTITSAPAQGTATVITSGTLMGAVRYTPPADYSGIVTFKYKLRDAQGRNSGEATVTVTIYPVAVDDSGARVAAGASASLNVLTNDRGSAMLPEVLTQSPHGTATVNGDGTIRFTASPTAPLGNTTFTYRVKTEVPMDSGVMELWSDNDTNATGRTGTVTVRIGTAVAAGDADFIVDASSASSPPWTTLDVQSAAGGSAANKVIVVSGPTRVDATGAATPSFSGSGSTTLRFRPVTDVAGIYTFTFELEDASGDRSETRTGTIRVLPVANDFTYGTEVRGAKTVTVSPRAGNAPKVAASRITYAVASQPSCTRTAGSGNVSATVALAHATDGNFSFRTVSIPNGWRGNCSFTYTVTYTGDGLPWTSNPATVFLSNVRGN